ncbi:small multi-drug export protein [Poseidonibacter lekithochrous]|uniref:small multi-drug export protein n=1 Tax=Poseidonibacter lekithochrous TaxID=1904463 RepID=UPI0008FCAA62|nr:small multi-drug export protein [Poseidonibacter lekithochrous]QKJ24585.1 putative small multi-drug export protein [Poseidonibacter lekithochrous]
MKLLIENLFKGKEGNIFLLALLMIFLLVILIIFCYQIDSSLANKITAMVLSNVFIGRVPALSLGYASELSHFIIISTNIYTEIILVMIIYPLFVLSFKGIVKVKALESFFEEVKQKKNEHKASFEKYGKFALFVFVLIPFWMTGPIVGSIIGYLIGMRHYNIIFIVFISTVFSISLWAIFLQEIMDLILGLDSQFMWIILFLIFFLLLLFRFKKVILAKIRNIFKKG